MGIVRTKQKEDDRNTQEKLLGGCVLCAVVNLLPHVQVVERSAVELERNATDIVEHEI